MSSHVLEVAQSLVPSQPHSLASLRSLCGDIADAVASLRGSQESDLDTAALEAAGVALWNESVVAKAARGERVCESVALLRGAAFILVEFAMRCDETTLDARRRLLSLAVAAARAFHTAQNTDNADALFARAEKYSLDAEEMDEAVIDALAKDSVLLLVYHAELVWLTTQDSLAFMMMNRACTKKLVERLTIREVDVIVVSCTKLSKSSTEKLDSIAWLKIALQMLESIVESPKTLKRKNEILLTLASEYILLPNVEQADRIVTQLIPNTEGLVCLSAIQIKLKVLDLHPPPTRSTSPSLDPSQPPTTLHEHTLLAQTIRTRIPLTNAHPTLVDLYLTILHSFARVSVPLALGLADALVAANANVPEKVGLVEKVFLTKIQLLVSVSGGGGGGTAVEKRVAEVEKVIAGVAAGRGVGKDTARMAQLAVWKCGENAMAQHLYQDAIDWFLVALKLVTGESGDERNLAILQRKLALCHVELKHYDAALTSCQKAAQTHDDPHALATMYIRFLVYLEQGMTTLAEQCLCDMTEVLRRGSGGGESGEKVLAFLLGAMERSFKCGNRVMLKRILQSVLLYNGFEDVEFWRRVMLVVLRCLIRMSIATDENEMDAEKFQELVKYADTSIKGLVSWKETASPTDDTLPEMDAEIAWISKTCWNLGLQASPSHATQACQFFRLAGQAMGMQRDGGEEVFMNRKICVYLAFMGEVELARDASQAGGEHVQRARTLFEAVGQLTDLKIFHQSELSRIYADFDASPPVSAKDQVYFQSIVLEFELILMEYEVLKMHAGAAVVERIQACLARAKQDDFPLDSFQRMADLSVRMHPPSGVVFVTVHTALECMMKKESELKLKQFAEWFRLMVSSGQVDGPKLELYKQALAIIKATGSKAGYPAPEVQWLQFTACAGDKKNAIQWCEMAFKLADHLPPEFSSQVAQMREGYVEILNEEE
ncbi:hypothetical protein HDU98_008272 [Podochytrium sp. JEL0797]|nr:hypothetical protein HDU98_008272 [Podochytrium sp. JEL0797]